MTIRPARPDDEAFLLRLTAQLGAFPVPRWRSREEIAAADHAILLRALHQPTEATSLLVAEEPSAQGRGLGGRLLEATEAWARDRGFRRITLKVFGTNTRARALYEKAGYEPETVHYHKLL